ncbi:MAG: hypothetical protein H6525_08000 [Actinobacteria bacterium]|nr:hypothetical protein [Actinomycetota bacterium]MCB9412774.1 hypothetical protein [Actinomycetota bacterium]
MPDSDGLEPGNAETDLVDRLHQLERRLRWTEERLAHAERRLRDIPEAPVTDSPGVIASTPADLPSSRWSRRALLLGGVGAATGIAHVAASATTATAAAGDAVVQGAGNNAGGNATSLASSNRNYTFLAENSASTATGLYGINDPGTGVVGQTSSGLGVLGAAVGTGTAIRGQATTGRAGDFFSSSGPSVRLRPGNLANFPVAGDWAAGDLVNDQAGNVWLCVQSGNPGRWRLLGGPQSAGAYVPLTPTRVFDSRRSTPDNGRILTSAQPRVVGVAFARDLDTGAPIRRLLPDGTRGVAANVTITDTTSSRGFVALTPGDAADYSASSLNWTAVGATIANGLILTTDALMRLKAFVRGGNTHLIIDITGYFASV